MILHAWYLKWKRITILLFYILEYYQLFDDYKNDLKCKGKYTDDTLSYC